MENQENLITIFKTKNEKKAAMVKSLFDKTDLSYIVLADGILDTYGNEKKEMNFNKIDGDIEFKVSSTDEKYADDLLEELEDEERLVSVYKSGNEALVLVVKSLLDEAEIPYLVKGEGLQGLFGVGVIGVGFNPITGPVEFQVMPEDEEYVRELIKEVEERDDEC